ncbi:hypothetical protein GCM10027262_73510 [Nocardia tengchongensis]
MRRRVRVRLAAEVHDDQPIDEIGVDELVRLAVDLGQAQIAGTELTAGLPRGRLQEPDIERTDQLDVLRDGKRDITRYVLGEPDSALRRRQRKRAFGNIGGRFDYRGSRLLHEDPMFRPHSRCRGTICVTDDAGSVDPDQAGLRDPMRSATAMDAFESARWRRATESATADPRPEVAAMLQLSPPERVVDSHPGAHPVPPRVGKPPPRVKNHSAARNEPPVHAPLQRRPYCGRFPAVASRRTAVTALRAATWTGSQTGEKGGA